MATPASFNNRAGLARAVNEHLADGTEVFVAEMGTYGPGEIADLCRWCPPDIAVITAIGPVHLERFGSEERIVEAKSEILVTAGDVVLPGRRPPAGRPGRPAPRPQGSGSCGARPRPVGRRLRGAERGRGQRVGLRRRTEVLAEGWRVPTGAQPTNLACAIAVALVLGVDTRHRGGRLADLPSVDHRLQAVRSGVGVTILDDTYNANPAGPPRPSRPSTVAAADAGDTGRSGRPRRAVVTPGMVELGRRQFDENRRFGAAIATVADHLVIVGRTNRRALLAGVASHAGSRPSRSPGGPPRTGGGLGARAHLGPGDAVLYENDLPDHYP